MRPEAMRDARLARRRRRARLAADQFRTQVAGNRDRKRRDHDRAQRPKNTVSAEILARETTSRERA